MQNGIHVVGVEGRMKVEDGGEDGGKRGVTRPFWCLVAFHPAGYHRCKAIGNGFDEGRPTCRLRGAALFAARVPLEAVVRRYARLCNYSSRPVARRYSLGRLDKHICPLFR